MPYPGRPEKPAILHFKKKPKKSAKWVKTFSISAKVLAVFSIIGTTLALIGQGVAASVESFVDIPHAALVGSPFDLIELSMWGVLQMMSNMTKNPPENLYMTTFTALLPWAMVGFTLVTFIFIFRHRIVQIHTWILPTVEKSIFRAPQPTDSTGLLIVKTGLIATLFNVVVPSVIVIFTLLCMVCALLVTLPTIAGADFGKAHIRKYVIEPTACAPLKPRAVLLAAKHASGVPLAQCVAAANDRRDFGRGRVVLATSTAIILYDPTSGRGWRVPTKDATIETVGSLAIPRKLVPDVQGDDTGAIKLDTPELPTAGQQ